MTKAEAVREFEQRVLPALEQGGDFPNFPSRRSTWAEFTASLCAQGAITNAQADSWRLPALVRGPRKEPPPVIPKSPYRQPPLFPELRSPGD